MVNFPPPAVIQSYVTVHALSCGFLTLPEELFVDPSAPGPLNTVPSLSFLIQHPSLSSVPTSGAQPTRILFDLGIRKDFKSSPAVLQELTESTKLSLITEPDVSDSLRDGGLEPTDVDLVVLSHVHWAHLGTPSDFEKSIFVVGSGSLELLARETSTESGEFFEANLLPPERTIELPAVENVSGEERAGGGHREMVKMTGFPTDLTMPMIEEYFSEAIGPIKQLQLVQAMGGFSSGFANISFVHPEDAKRAVNMLNGVHIDGRPIKLELFTEAGTETETEIGLFSNVKWEKFGPLSNVIDIFSDGSVYLVDPGHLVGHLNLLARLGPKRWLYLAGDACHDRRMMRREVEIGTWESIHRDVCCIHTDREAAESMIELIVGIEKMEGVEVVLAHDTEWLHKAENKERFWPGKM